MASRTVSDKTIYPTIFALGWGVPGHVKVSNNSFAQTNYVANGDPHQVTVRGIAKGVTVP